MEFCEEDWRMPPEEYVPSHPSRWQCLEPTTKTRQQVVASDTSSTTPMGLNKPLRMSFLHLPPEIRNLIYELVLVKPTRTTVMLDDDWKQPSLSLTCHQIQAELLSFWFGRYRFSIWPDRYGKKYPISSLMAKWMARAGSASAQICNLEINARMPDGSRFCWEVVVKPDAPKEGIVQRVSHQWRATSPHGNLQALSKTRLPAAPVTLGNGSRAAISKSAVMSRVHMNEADIAQDVSDALGEMLSRSQTGLIGIDEVRMIMSILNQHGLKVPDRLTSRNPSWTKDQSSYFPLPKSAKTIHNTIFATSVMDVEGLQSRREALTNAILASTSSKRPPVAPTVSVQKTRSGTNASSAGFRLPAISRRQFKKAIKQLPIPTARCIPNDAEDGLCFKLKSLSINEVAQLTGASQDIHVDDGLSLDGPAIVNNHGAIRDARQKSSSRNRNARRNDSSRNRSMMVERTHLKSSHSWRGADQDVGLSLFLVPGAAQKARK